MKNYKISVCIATFNGEKYIKEQIESILIQLDKEDEIIISDNFSTDNTIAIVNNFEDNRIKVVYFSPVLSYKANNYERKLINIYENFKNAFLNSTGSLVFFCDQDDIWFPNKIASCIKHLIDHDLVVHNAVLLTKDVANNKLYSEVISFKQSNFWEILKNNPFLGCCIVAKRSIVENAFKFESSIIPHDTWLAIVAIMKSKKAIKVLNEPLIYYRIHDNNNSFLIESKNSLFFKIKYRLKLVIFSVLVKLNNKKI